MEKEELEILQPKNSKNKIGSAIYHLGAVLLHCGGLWFWIEVVAWESDLSDGIGAVIGFSMLLQALYFLIALFYAIMKPDNKVTRNGQCLNKGSQIEGECVYFNSNGKEEYYSGEFLNGERNGKGQYRFHNKAIYIGEWKDDYMHGQGTYTHPEGTIQKGLWENGEFIEQQ